HIYPHKQPQRTRGRTAHARGFYDDLTCAFALVPGDRHWRVECFCGAGVTQTNWSVHESVLFSALGHGARVASWPCSWGVCGACPRCRGTDYWPYGALWVGAYPRAWYSRGHRSDSHQWQSGRAAGGVLETAVRRHLNRLWWTFWGGGSDYHDRWCLWLV